MTEMSTVLCRHYMGCCFKRTQPSYHRSAQTKRNKQNKNV